MVVLAVLAVYSNSFTGEFIFDDSHLIVENPTIRQLWPLGHCATPCTWLPGLNQQVNTRPVLNFSFALNYAMGGVRVWGYHALNLAIHIANALLLFGILRRTLPRLAGGGKFGGAAIALSLAISILWAVHPLQTESVTYIVQRAESLVALFYLLTLYCVIRGAASGRSAAWYAASVLSCLLGMGTKEVMVTAPVVVFLFDGMFVASSFREALTRRRWLYAGLALAWVFLAYLVVTTGELVNLYSSHAGPRAGADSWSYAATQMGVILHYLRLSVWPDPLILSYDWPVARSVGEILPAAIVIALLLAATLWGVINRKPWSFPGAWFLLVLSPTSSVVPLEDLVFEHRMYLPLAAVLTTLVLAGYAGGRAVAERTTHLRPTMLRIGTSGLVVIASIFGGLAFQRNKDYANQLSIWQDTVMKAPRSARAHLGLGNALNTAGKMDLAVAQYRKTLMLKPDYPEAHLNLGYGLAATGRMDEAIHHFEQTLRLQPGSYEAHNNLGIAYISKGSLEKAGSHFREALRINPSFGLAKTNLEKLNELAKRKH